MKGLIQASINNPYAVIVMSLAISVLGALTLQKVPVDILPVFKSPAVQVLTFYGGMPPGGMEKDITNRMERWTGQANGMKRQESRSILGASIVRNYFQDDQDPNGALTQVNSLALAVIPNLPPGTLPPVVLPFDPTSTTPVALVALDSKTQSESILYDVGRYEVRNMIMQKPGAVAPVVIGGKIRAVMLYLDETKMQSRKLSPAEVMKAVEKYNLFFPSGDVRIGDLDYALSSNSMFDLVAQMGEIPVTSKAGEFMFLRDVAKPKDSAFIQTNIVRVNGRRQVYIPVYRQVGASTLSVVDTLKESLPDMKEPDQPAGHRPQAGHGPVGIRAGLHRGPGAGRDDRRDPVLAGHSGFPGPMAHDDHRHRDLAAVGARGRHLPALHRANDQRHDPGRADAGHRSDDRQRHHLPGEHAPPSRPGHRLPRRPPSTAPARWPCRSWCPRCAPSWSCRRWP